MCSHYEAERSRRKLERMGVHLAPDWQAPSSTWHIFPTQVAPIIRRPAERDSGDDAVPVMELVAAHFGLLPGFARDIDYGRRTYNARSETVANLPSFKHAWAKPRHCIVPADAIYEPDWRTGKSIPTRITRADGEALGIAGIWQPWKTPGGDWVYSFSMLTINADSHPMFNKLHKPDPKRPADQQDKRMPVILSEDAYGAWLDANPEQSMDFMRQFPADRLTATAQSISL